MTYKLPVTSTIDIGLMQVGSGMSVVNGIVSATGNANVASVSVTGTTTTVGPAPVTVLSGMTITPGAGNYLALFNSQFSSTGTIVTDSRILSLIRTT